MATGSYTFRLNRPDATEVYVTGSFDNWSRIAKLQRRDDGVFEATVQLPVERTLYKFVVDGNWIVDPEAYNETEPSGNQNSVLEPSQISQSPATAPLGMSSQQEPPFVPASSAAPNATSAALAAQVPIESDQKTAEDLSRATISSAHPESTTAALAAQVPLESEKHHTNGSANLGSANISSVAPQSTTAQLASQVPLESEKHYTDRSANLGSAHISSVAPQSTTAQLASQVPLESEKHDSANTNSAALESAATQISDQLFGQQATDRPTPTETPSLDNVPGFFPQTPSNEKTMAQADSEANATQRASQGTFSVNPLPASDTVDNPITLKPGEPVPRDVTTQGLTSKVTLDKESYEQGPATLQYPLGSMMLPEVVTPAEQREMEGRGVLDIPPISRNMIPESSLPITSASDAGVHHAHVPDVVKESQERAHVPPEASNVQAAVDKKAEVEEELKHEVPTAPAISEKPITTTVADTAKQAANAVATNAGPMANAAAGNTKAVASNIADNAAPAANTAAEKTKAAANTTADTVGPYASTVADKVQAAAASVTASVAGVAAAAGIVSAGSAPAENVPEVVKESQAEARVPAEASAIASAVEKKKELETELLNETSAVPPVDTSKPTAAGAPSSTIPKESLGHAQTHHDATNHGFHGVTLNMVPEVTTGVDTHQIPQTSLSGKPVDAVPSPVKDSLAQAGEPAEAAGSKEAVHNKENLESELRQEVPPTKPAAESTTLPAATSAQKATSAPTSSTGGGIYKNGTANGVSNGVNGANGTNGAKMSLDGASPKRSLDGASPKKSMDSTSGGTHKKRLSFFGRLKERFHSHKKDTA